MNIPVRLTKGGTAFGYKVASLRTEQRKGNLAIIRIAGKDHVTESAIKDMELKCQIQLSPPASISKSLKAVKASGSFSITTNTTPLDAARMNLDKLKKRLPITSLKLTGQIPANVHLLKSGAQT